MGNTTEYYLGSWVLSNSEEGGLLNEIATFYSKHYGIWSANNPDRNRRKRQITLSVSKIKEWLNEECAELWTVRNQQRELIGYAIALKGKSASKENIIWITQFVIHTDYRNTGIGKKLLLSIWGFSSFFAWGLVTANPYAIRALEKITRRRCDPERIHKNHQQILNFGIARINYITNDIDKKIGPNDSKVNTEFFVDHTDIPERIRNVTSEDKPWLLGDIEEGWEWFAFTFNDQEPFELTQDEITVMLEESDSIAKQAYDRMPMNASTQSWARYTTQEIDYIIHECGLQKNQKILDVGCGTGRHTQELSRRGYEVVGIDYAESLISKAKDVAKQENLSCEFQCLDITSDINLPSKFDVALCLYDVIGSYADNTKNEKILENLSKQLNHGGCAVISVMNLHLTEHKAEHKFCLRESSKALLELPASHTMEQTGNIFNPTYYLLDEETKIVYRKESFSFNKEGKHTIPTELIVRDKRYYKDEIIQMCQTAGLEVVKSRFVNAGWQQDFNSTDNKAKEILLICRKL